MQATKQQRQAIKSVVRAANRRLERASEGQRRALEYYVRKETGQAKWSAATKGMTYEQASKLIAQLNKFMESEYSTIRGWKKIKEQSVAKANQTLGRSGYTLTDEELSEIFMQVDTGDYKEKYRAINLVQVEKQKPYWSGGAGQIAAAIAQKASYQDALKAALPTMRA